MKFNVFVLPFISGLVFVFVYVVYKFRQWIVALNKEDKQKLKEYFFSKNIFSSIKEIFNESLLHKKVFRANRLLGYMHMSLAFGWFLLIALGNIEIKFYSEYSVNPPYVPIFLKFFEPTPVPHFFGRGSNFLMDLLLLMILTGVGLAIYKRFRTKAFGLKKTSRHTRFDKIVLTALWFIFPLRLLAESFTSGIYNNGSFLTGSLGHIFASFLPLQQIVYPTWWLYSISLGAFFFALPFSRYMHIPTETLLIVFRNAGIKAKLTINSYSKIEIHSCSRCGICIDPCQISSALNINNIQPVYFIRDLRYSETTSEVIDNCLMCGRCNNACPVGIDSVELRNSKRVERNNALASNFSYIKHSEIKKTDVLYFAGCMTHLTPAIKASMVKIFDKSGVSWQFMDKDGSICCGRPLMLSGQHAAAQNLINANTNIIKNSGAKILVTSCPICYKAFKNEYSLGIEVLHHSQYLLRLINEEKIAIQKTSQTAIYHDPCELGRGSGVYLEPRLVIKQAVDLITTKYASEKALCCGGSLANLSLSSENKKKIATNALNQMNIELADILITSCPLCKKTFAEANQKPVLDIAQLIASNLIDKGTEHELLSRKNQLSEVI